MINGIIKNINNNKDMIYSGTIIFMAGIIYFIWALKLPVSMAPDEMMRFDVPMWIYEHNALPRGDLPELRNSLWGFSYAFTPYLPSIISVLFMKIVSIFSDNQSILIIAARMTSVFAGLGTAVLCLKIGNILFKDKKCKYLLAILICFLPQFVFLCSYLNNDAFAVFTVMIILYYWVKGIKEHWCIKNCIGLGVGIGLCALTYYNAYGYILCSIFVFCISIFIDYSIKNKWKFLFLHGMLIFMIAFSIAGWFFIRNYIIYDGDFLAMDSMYACGELYAIDELKLSKRPTYYNLSKSVLDMMLHTRWLVSTSASFFAVFGAMKIVVCPIFYILYGFVALIGMIAFFCKIWKDKKYTKILIINMFLAVLIVLILSIRYSYTIDYQAQGRYLMPAMPVLMIFLVIGYKYIESYMIEKKKKIKVIGIIAILWLLMFLFIFAIYAIPLCMGGV